MAPERAMPRPATLARYSAVSALRSSSLSSGAGDGRLGDPDRQRDAQGGVGEGLAHRVLEGVRGLLAAARRGDQEGELVAAQAPGDALALQDAADLAEHEVARVVAVEVVDALEVVDVADEDGRAGVGQTRAGDLRPVAAVEQAGELVLAGLALQALDLGGQAVAGARRARGHRRQHGHRDLLELDVVDVQDLEGVLQQGGIGVVAVEQGHGGVGGLDAEGDGVVGGVGRVVGADGTGDVGVEARVGGEERAGLAVVDAELLALGTDAQRARGGVDRQGVDPVGAEGGREDELAEVVQEAGQVGGAGVDAGATGHLGRAGGDLDGMDVQLAARDAAGAGGLLEEVADGGLHGQAADRAAADERDGLVERRGADGPRVHRRVGVAQDVDREVGVLLEGRDDVGRGGGRVLGDLADLDDAAPEHGQLAQIRDRPSDRDPRFLSDVRNLTFSHAFLRSARRRGA
nr:hypothetical protein [Baekduia soli]